MYWISVLGTMSFVAIFVLIFSVIAALVGAITEWIVSGEISVITKAFIIIAAVSLLIVIFVPQKEDLIKIFGV
jgi:hypothetical protein